MRERPVSSSRAEPPTEGPVAAEAVLVTGVYGVGKSTVVGQMADLLEERGHRYAALDLDWLAWADDGIHDSHTDQFILLMNLASVVKNYRALGIERVLMAGWLGSAGELERLRSTMDMPMRVVRLTLGYEEIVNRAGRRLTTGRADDMAQTAAWLAAGAGEGLEDLAIPNERPAVEVATTILEWMGWS